MGLGHFGSREDFAGPVVSGIQWVKYLFHLSFAATSTTIISIAMRMKLKAYYVFAF
jgi:ammonia channel protein AmtB